MQRNAFLESVETTAVLSGWVAARQCGMRNSSVSDAISVAALKGIREWFTTSFMRHPERYPDPETLPGEVQMLISYTPERFRDSRTTEAEDE